MTDGDEFITGYDKPATKWDVAVVAAQASLGMREMITLMLALHLEQKDDASERIAAINTRANNLWANFEALADGKNAKF